MPYLVGNDVLEKLNEAVSVSFACTFICTSSAAPTYTVQPPANPASIGFVFNTGAGTLLTGVTFAGTNTAANWAGGSILNPTFGLEIVDGSVAASGSVLYAHGVVDAVTNATTNLQQNAILAWDRVTNDGYAAAGAGIALNIRAGLVATITGLLSTMNGATASNIKASFRVVYLQR